MLTRTSGGDYSLAGIYMNSVDTGWINDENPHPTAAKAAAAGAVPPPPARARPHRALAISTKLASSCRVPDTAGRNRRGGPDPRPCGGRAAAAGADAVRRPLPQGLRAHRVVGLRGRVVVKRSFMHVELNALIRSYPRQPSSRPAQTQPYPSAITQHPALL